MEIWDSKLGVFYNVHQKGSTDPTTIEVVILPKTST